MKTRSIYFADVLWFSVISMVAVFVGSSVYGQDSTRGLRVKKLEESRPVSATPADPKQPRTYRSTAARTMSTSELRSSTEAVIGVTLWRLRPAESADNKDARILEHHAAKNTEWIRRAN